jgi:outer membrane lipoprotein SlyB
MVSLILPGGQEDREAVGSAKITYPRAGWHRLGVAALATLALSGCAPSTPPRLAPQALAPQALAPQALAPQAMTAPSGPHYATVETVRPILASADMARDPEAAILAAMSVSQSGTATSATSAEIVVRMDGGETLSVIEPDSADLAPGRRVIVMPGELTRLVPVPPRT